MLFEFIKNLVQVFSGFMSNFNIFDKCSIMTYFINFSGLRFLHYPTILTSIFATVDDYKMFSIHLKLYYNSSIVF